MKKYAFLFFFLFLFGCCSKIVAPDNYHKTTAPPYQRGLLTDVYIDEDFTPQERFNIESALGMWNTALNGYREFRVIDDRKHITSMDEVSTYDLVFIHMDGDDFSPLAMVDEIPGHRVYFYETKMSHIKDQEVVIAHEIGHILGAQHNDHKGSLLFPYYVQQAYEGSCVDVYTMKEIVKANYWMKLENTNYCKL